MEEQPRGRRGQTPRQAAEISAEPKDEGLFRFLIDLFQNGFPQKLILATVHGPSGQRIGQPVKEYAYRPNDAKPDHEMQIERANDILREAQQDCDGLGKKMRYGVFAFDLAKGATFYSRYLMRLSPSGASQEKFETGNGFDDEDNGVLPTRLLISLLDSERRDKRWMMEQFSNVISGIMERDSERIAQLEEMQNGMFERSQRYIAATEEALSRADDRKLRHEREQMKTEMMKQGFALLMDFVPVAKVYLTKGKVGVAEGVKRFVDSLSEEEQARVFGIWDAQTRERKAEGILSLDQCNFVLGIINGQIDPSRMPEFVATLEPQQFQAIQESVPMDKLGKLLMLVEATRKQAGETAAPA